MPLIASFRVKGPKGKSDFPGHREAERSQVVPPW